MHPGTGRRHVKRRGQPSAPKRPETKAELQPASGFENLIPRVGDDDYFFSKLLEPADAAEFLAHGGDAREPLLGDPRVGMGVSAAFHVVLVLFMLFEPALAELLTGVSQPPQEVAEIDKSEPLVLFMDDPMLQQTPPPVPVVPVVPVPEPPAVADAEPQPSPPDNRMLIPKAMLPPERRAEIMNDLPFSSGNTDEFYTDEEVKDPGTEGEPEQPAEPEPVLAAESGEDDLTTDEIDGPDELSPESLEPVEIAEARLTPEEIPDFVFGEPLDAPPPPDPVESRTREEAMRARQPIRPEPSNRPVDLGEGGENGRFTDIRRFLASAQFHNPEGGLVANSENTLYYNDKGANFVPWIRRMLSEVGRTWRAGMPWAASIYAGHTAVRFRVARDGTVLGYETLVPSGVPGFDNIAVGAIRAADLLPLPNDYPDDTFEIVLVFWYNERPYDIFG